ncbi:hypothetical protein [Pontibacter sp. G13]|uniref:hypothetical protein n=1 Tax=Pontibacter sp. G13 TaxID=3074898 RepID=UPI002889182B|nr:hypothetical protein [Pontibacter sp. G13]WNJ18365.1 hypothetical protein RJD25_26220 [Pontibacter sp. G13]
MSELFTPRQQRIFSVLHLTASAVTLIKAYDKLSHGKFLLGGIILILGLVMVFYTIRHHQIELKRPLALPYFFLYEAIVLSIVAYLNLDKGYVYIYFLSIGLYIFCFFTVRRRLKQKLNV